jgi:putative DNA primase/helicase
VNTPFDASTFQELCAAVDAKVAGDNGPSEDKRADDWLAAFSRKSQEALAKRAAEKETVPAPDEKALIAALARKDHADYDKVRAEVAHALGVRVGTLDDKVEAVRKRKDETDDALPHWKVEPWTARVEGAALLDSIRQVFRRYIVLPKDADIGLALWVLHAWTMDAGDISPFMVLVSPTKRCGKTSVLILLYFLTPKSELASNISPAALFRYVEAVHPTLLMDEFDASLKNNEEARGILDGGHTRLSAYVIRNVEVNGEHKPRRFSTWAAKAIATIRSVADTIEDRSVRITLQRKARNAKVERLRRRDSEEFKALRSKAARWAADNFDSLTDPDPAVPEVLNDRAADNWRPLLAIAELAGGSWPEQARRAACALSGEESDGAVNVELLKDIRTAFGDDEEIRSADLVEKLAADKERPWADWKHGRPLSQKQLGGLLSHFGIRSETVSIPGFADAKGYRRVRFEEAWEVYCPGQNTLSGLRGTSEASKRRNTDGSSTSRDFQSVAATSGDGSKNGNLSYSHAGSDASTLRNGKNSGQGHSDQEIAPRDPWADYPAIPEFCRRCDHCGQPGTRADPLHPWDWPGRPDGIRLHGRCEAPWFDRAAAPMLSAVRSPASQSPTAAKTDGRQTDA